MQQRTNFLLLLFLILDEAQHVSRDTPSIIRSLKLHKQLLVLHTWKVVGRAVVARCQVAYATWQRILLGILLVTQMANYSHLHSGLCI